MTMKADGVDSPSVIEDGGVDSPNSGEESQELSNKTSMTLEEQIATLKQLNQEAIRSRDAAKRKLREMESTLEKTVSESAKVKDKLISRTVNESIHKALVDAGVMEETSGAAFKLIDKSAIALNDEFEVDLDSVKAVVEALKASESFLFKKPEETPLAEKKEELPDVKVEHKPVGNSVKRPSDKPTQLSAYAIAIQNAKSQKELNEVMRQHGIIS